MEDPREADKRAKEQQQASKLCLESWVWVDLWRIRTNAIERSFYCLQFSRRRHYSYSCRFRAFDHHKGRRWARCAEARGRQRGTWWASPTFLGSLDASRPCRCGFRTCNAPQHLSCVRGENGSYADEREVPPKFSTYSYSCTAVRYRCIELRFQRAASAG